jgi:hypothetical protein
MKRLFTTMKKQTFKLRITYYSVDHLKGFIVDKQNGANIWGVTLLAGFSLISYTDYRVNK